MPCGGLEGQQTRKMQRGRWDRVLGALPAARRLDYDVFAYTLPPRVTIPVIIADLHTDRFNQLILAIQATSPSHVQNL